MKIEDPVFAKAVQAIDTGDLKELGVMLKANPSLVKDPLIANEEGYFKDPYLLWFVAGNPIRNETLPENIADVARLIIEFAQTHQEPTLADQINYTLALVCSGRVAREQKLQGALIDLLVHYGGDADGAMMPALFHKETEAMTKLIEHGATTTLPIAVALGNAHEVERLLPGTTKTELQTGLTAAAFYGKADILKTILQGDVDVNAWNPKGFHDHSKPLHQAVMSGSVECVRLLVEAGADIRPKDKIHNSTPLTWAIYCNQPKVVDYLHEKIATNIVNILINNQIVAPNQKDQAVRLIVPGLKDLIE